MKKALSLILSLMLLISVPALAQADLAGQLLEKAVFFKPSLQAEETPADVPAEVPDDAPEAEVVGTWHLTGMVYLGTNVSPAVFGLHITMNLNADGTSLLASDEAEESAVWVFQENQVLITDSLNETLAFVLEAGALTAEIDGVTMIFTQEPADAPQPFPLSDPLPVTDISAFNGEWVNAFMLDPATGYQIPLTFAGYTSRISLTDGYAKMDLSGLVVPFNCQFSDGALVYIEGDASMKITLHEGDILACLIDDTQTFYYYRETE